MSIPMNPAQITFNTVTQKDLPKLRKWAEMIWRDHFPGIITFAQIDYMLEKMYNPQTILQEMEQGIQWFFIQANDWERGYFSYEVSDDSLHIHKLYADSELHGQGLGFATFCFLKEQAQKHGVNTMDLWVNRSNILAIRAYARWGFRIVADRRKEIGEGFVMDDYQMRVIINS
jgi:diamine N-acetyltransferase